MLIYQNFTGGNIRIEDKKNNVYFLNNELRDTSGDWFYWAFCAEGGECQTFTFKFPNNRIGYFGPAISYDLKSWEWLGQKDDANSFTYTFKKNENKVYFAHNMLYHPDRFFEFAEHKGIEIKELCKSQKQRGVPYITFGEGDRIMLFTARHHACESTGNYVMEGVIEHLLNNPIANTKVICVPFVDFDGVVDGDQGKNRMPYDHNRDYSEGEPSIYPQVAAIRKIADDGILYGFDFHSPWHLSGRNDTAFIVQKLLRKSEEYTRFSSYLESSINEYAFQYDKRNDILPDMEWNSSKSSCFSKYMLDVAKAKLAFTLETAYFGTQNNKFGQQNSVEFGRCFAKSLRRFDEEAVKLSFTGDLMCSKNMIDKAGENFDQLFDNIRTTLKDTDFLVGNCETTISGEECGYTEVRYSFNTPESYLGALKECNFRLLTLANNHCMDRDEQGIINTIKNCNSYGFDTIGVYDSQEARDTIYTKNLHGIKVAFINYTYGTNAFAHNKFLKHQYKVNLYQPEETLEGYVHLLNSNEQIAQDVNKLYHTENKTFDNIINPYLNRLKSDIEKAKKSADFVVMVSHCGGQYNADVDAYTKYICDFIKQCGADVIVGHHPHIIQKSDTSDRYLTVYSVGTFICDYLGNNSLHFKNNKVNPYFSILLNLYLTKENNVVKMRAGFKILTVVVKNDVPQTYDAYQLYKKTKDSALKENILFFANHFAGKSCFSKVQQEYDLTLDESKI